MKTKYYVIPYDLLDIVEIKIENDLVKLSMYCEIGGSKINPDTPPIFYFNIRILSGLHTFTIDNGDLTPLEVDKYNECISVFLQKMSDNIKTGRIPIPSVKQLIGMEQYDITQHNDWKGWDNLL